MYADCAKVFYGILFLNHGTICLTENEFSISHVFPPVCAQT
jgi:hypothetical protein